MGEITRRINEILRDHFKSDACEVRGELVEEHIYWVDIDIHIESIPFSQFSNLVNAIESELRIFGLRKDKFCFTQPAKNATMRISFSLPYPAKVNIVDLMKVGLIRPHEIIFGYHHGKKYEATITPDGKIKLLHDNEIFDSPSSAAGHVTTTSQNGWYWWKYRDESGKELWITSLRDKYYQSYDC